MHYRDLKADLAGEMRRVAEFLGIDVREALWPPLVTAAGFEAMKRIGDTLHPFIARTWIGGTARFFDKGENDRWRDVLSAEEIDAFDAMMTAKLPPECARWLQTGRLAMTGP